MAENTAIDTVQDDELVDEALDRTSGGKFGPCGAVPPCLSGR
jgi:hypothetical protein